MFAVPLSTINELHIKEMENSEEQINDVEIICKTENCQVTILICFFFNTMIQHRWINNEFSMKCLMSKVTEVYPLFRRKYGIQLVLKSRALMFLSKASFAFANELHKFLNNSGLC